MVGILMFLLYSFGLCLGFLFCCYFFRTQLLKSFEESFPDVNFPPVPERGNFNLKEVLKAPYFFN